MAEHFKQMLYEVPLFFWVTTAFIFWFSACVGSFLNVVIWRIPRGESIVHPPSHCPKCNYRIPFYLNVPILAWLVLRGRCANCKEPISARYPLIEAFTGILITMIWFKLYHNGQPLSLLLPYGNLAAVLISASMIDFDLKILPNKLNLYLFISTIILTITYPLMDLPTLQTALPGIHQGHTFTPMVRQLMPSLELTNFTRGLLEAFLGTAAGLLTLTGIIEVGKILFGTKTISSDQTVPFELTPKVHQITLDQEIAKTDELLARTKDYLLIEVASGEITFNDGRSESLDGKTVIYKEDQLKYGDQSIAPAEVKTVTGHTKKMKLPQEVMGYGDVKLLAAIGALMGPEACFYIIPLSAFIALGLVIALAIGARRHAPEIPFGPFISIAALILFFLS